MSARRARCLALSVALIGCAQAHSPSSSPSGSAVPTAPTVIDYDVSMQIEVAHPREYVSGFPMFVGLTFSSRAPDEAILALSEARPTSVYTRWVRASDGARFERGSVLHGASPSWYEPGRDYEFHDGPLPLAASEPGPPSVRVVRTPRRFLTMIGDAEPGCYAISLRLARWAEPNPFEVCVRAPTDAESADLDAARALIPAAERDATHGWEEWMDSPERPETLPIGAGDPLAYLRLERFIHHAPRPLAPIGNGVFDAIDPFFAPEVMVLRLQAAAARDDREAFLALAREAERTVPEKWLDIQYARGSFALRAGDKQSFEAASDALWDEHHRWAVDLERRWRSAHPDEPLAPHADTRR
ncbi:MAG: hypothetical protein U0414_03990 [Polyangiaceae bacterium]